MAGLKWNTGNLYYSTVELGYQQFGGWRPTTCLVFSSTTSGTKTL